MVPIVISRVLDYFQDIVFLVPPQSKFDFVKELTDCCNAMQKSTVKVQGEDFFILQTFPISDTSLPVSLILQKIGGGSDSL